MIDWTLRKEEQVRQVMFVLLPESLIGHTVLFLCYVLYLPTRPVVTIILRRFLQAVVSISCQPWAPWRNIWLTFHSCICMECWRCIQNIAQTHLTVLTHALRMSNTNKTSASSAGAEHVVHEFVLQFHLSGIHAWWSWKLDVMYD